MKQLTVLLACAGLAACGNTPAPPPLFCPNVAVLQQGANLPEFLPGREDVAALITEARITGVAGTCTLLKAKKTLRVTFKTGFAASNGPANNDAAVTLPYFISISRGDDIISKTSYAAILDFDGNASSATGVSKPVTVELPNVPESADIDILASFQLSQAQSAFIAAQPPEFGTP